MTSVSTGRSSRYSNPGPNFHDGEFHTLFNGHKDAIESHLLLRELDRPSLGSGNDRKMPSPQPNAEERRAKPTRREEKREQKNTFPLASSTRRLPFAGDHGSCSKQSEPKETTNVNPQFLAGYQLITIARVHIQTRQRNHKAIHQQTATTTKSNARKIVTNLGRKESESKQERQKQARRNSTVDDKAMKRAGSAGTERTKDDDR